MCAACHPGLATHRAPTERNGLTQSRETIHMFTLTLPLQANALEDPWPLEETDAAARTSGTRAGKGAGERNSRDDRTRISGKTEEV